MDKILTLLIFILYIIPEIDLAIGKRKFVHQRDMSEHCKRRVVPSVFIGKKVMGASSQVMHFSQLDVPYSCFLSIRAESGYNIILVMELLTEDSLKTGCSRNSNQFIVYELGETFGGYWGPQPDAMMKSITRNYTKYYTLKTTQTIETKRTRKYKNITEKALQHTFPPTTHKDPDYIRMEVPLVNVSGNLQLGGPSRHSYNAEELFDLIYDVTPRNGVEYETSIMPLVQFSIRPQQGPSEGYNDGKPRYELEYDVQGLTMDSRLIFSTIRRRTMSKKRNWFANRRYNFRKKSTSLFSRKDTALNVKKFFTRWSSSPSDVKLKTTKIPTLDPKYSTISWKHIDDIMKYYNITIRSTEVLNVTLRNILHDIAYKDHNSSVYLVPNISIYGSANDNLHNNINRNTFHVRPFTTRELQPISLSEEFKTSSRFYSTINLLFNNTFSYLNKISLVNYTSTEYLIAKSSHYYNQTTMDIVSNKTQSIDDLKENFELNKVNKIKENASRSELSNETLNKPTDDRDSIMVRLRNQSEVTKAISIIQKGTMVDHESWENIVQAAPVMAVALNTTELLINNKNNNTLDRETKSQKSKRRKRYIQSLLLDNSRPKNQTTERVHFIQTEPIFQVSDMQDIARLVELQDDEMEGRVALRYLRNYVGSALYNICDFSEPKSRQTFMFNASRIVIAFNNFTLDRLMLVVTPAQVLASNTSRCTKDNLECQVVGARVCIDSMNSCDGVPNCGSYDIYDEDRLQCGIIKGLQHNVYLTAFTFLAVLLTMIYTVHYWLKRCVPRVSEAFFIYTDTSENTLLLDTVMRSPMYADDASAKLVLMGHEFDDDILYQVKEADVSGNKCLKMLKTCWKSFICQRKRKESIPGDKAEDTKRNKPAKMFSFAELELSKIVPLISRDEAIQTVNSDFEMEEKDLINYHEISHAKDSLAKLKTTKTHYEDQNIDENLSNELNLIKFAKITRSSSSQSEDIEDIRRHRRLAVINEDEKEIKSTVYERQSNKSLTMSETITCEIHSERPKKRVDAKRLRFEDTPTMIPSDQKEDDNLGKSTARRSVVFDVGHKQDLDSIHKIEDEGNSKDFRRFWGGKSKKGKKK